MKVIAKYSFLGFLILALPIILSAQDNDSNEMYKEFSALFDNRKYADAMMLLLEEVGKSETMQRAENPILAEYFRKLGSVYNLQRNYAEADFCFKQSLKILDNHPQKNKDLLVSILDHLYLSLFNQSKYDEAEPYAERELKLIEQDGSDDSIKVCSYMLACIYYEQGKYSKAEPLFKSVLKMDEKELGEEHSSLAWLHILLARTNDRLERYSKAEFHYKSAIYILEILEQGLGMRFYGYSYEEYADISHSLAALYEKIGKNEEAEKVRKREKYILSKTKQQNNSTSY